MSIILKPSALKVKDDNGNYIGTNMFAAESTQEYLDAIETIGTQTQTAISTASTQAQAAMEAKAEQTIESIPEDYTELAGDVAALKADLSENVGDLKGALSDYIHGIVHITPFVQNSYVAKTGIIAPYNGRSRTKFIDISAYDAIVVQSSASSDYNCFYSSAQENSFLSYFNVGTSKTTVQIPENAKYVIFSNSDQAMSNLVVEYITPIVIEQQNLQNAIVSISEQLTEEGTAISTYRCNISASGLLQAVTSQELDIMMYAAKVKKGVSYDVTTSESTLICGFFDSEQIPYIRDTSYNSSRIVQNSKIVTAPIDGWIVFRSKYVKTNEGIAYYSSVDTEARDAAETSLNISSNLSQSVANLIAKPAVENGSNGNPANPTAVCVKAVSLGTSVERITIKNTKPIKASGNYYKYTITSYKGESYYNNRAQDISFDKNEEYSFAPDFIINSIDGVDGFGVTVQEYDSNDNAVTNRKEDYAEYNIFARYTYSDQVQTQREIWNDETEHNVLNSRHALSPLTLLHFSDIHANVSALSRIINDSVFYGALIDDVICTGDMTSNEYGEIADWWYPSVLTCVGNHDTASYSGGVYNWTALSMADRDAYYIAPFESNWGITHISGTSYYYKDYTAQNVRLIVMDVMLYESSDQTEANAQTAWLSNLLSDAISQSLHVIIAIHCPHGGAKAVECSFTKFDADIMPTYQDCDTPQSVISAVSSAITSGLKFIGYICGHTHQDYIWDAENDKTQLMYCITCATTTKNNWINSDQDRSKNVDAYNVITIDTANTLVKIVRGGGADIDGHMRTRKAVCFNYSTGEIVGEVL